jgi:hypothetical protein
VVEGDDSSERVLDTGARGTDAVAVAEEFVDGARSQAELLEGGGVEVAGDAQVVDDALRASVRWGRRSRTVRGGGW